MPADLFEEIVELRIALLDAEERVQPSDPGYPYPTLRLSGEETTRSFRAVVLENSYLRASFCPELGGRLLGLLDKRTDTQVTRFSEPLVAEKGSSRGLHLPQGLQFQLVEEDRLNSMGPVSYQLEHPDDAEDPAVLWLSESSVANGLSWHLKISLPADAALIEVEARVLNRLLQPLPYNAGFVAHESDVEVLSDHLTKVAGGEWRRFGALGEISPRQVDTWSAKIVPYSGLGSARVVSQSLAMSLEAAVIRLQPTQTLGQAKVIIATKDGQNHEAPVHLYPETILELPVGELKPVAIAVLDQKGEELLRWPSDPPPTRKAPPAYQFPAEGEPEELIFDVARRAVAQVMLGIRELGAKRFAEADLHFEKALLYNAEDPLVWWIKAVTQRLLDAKGDRPELPNAHYLSPLEPVLKAEAFLSQSEAMGREANPLLKGMVAEDLVEVACLLIGHGLPDQAHRWIDEALRHRDLAMLRYLMAYVLLLGTRMVMEAASHVAAAARAELPPYPWRPVEREAIAHLRERFPNDAGLQRLPV